MSRYLDNTEERELNQRLAMLDKLTWRMRGVLGPGDDTPVEMLERLIARPSAIRFEAVDGDRRVTVQVPDALAVDPGARGMFRDVAEQMFRSGRAERARRGRVVGEAGDREGPAGVDPGRTSPTTEHDTGHDTAEQTCPVCGRRFVAFHRMCDCPGVDEPVPFVPLRVETTFGTPVVEGEPTHVDGPFVPLFGGIEGAVGGGMILVEEPVGPPVQPAPPALASVTSIEPDCCGHWSGLIGDFGRVVCFRPAAHDGDHEDDTGEHWTDQLAAERQAPAEPDPTPVLCSTPTCPLFEGHDGDCHVSPIAARLTAPADTVAEHEADDGVPTRRIPPTSLRPNREPRQVQPGELTGRARGGKTSGEKRAAERAERMAKFVAGFRQSNGKTIQDQLRDAAKAAGITVGTASHYLRDAREAGLLPDTLRSMAKAAGPIGKLPVPPQAEPDRSRMVVQSHRTTIGGLS